MVFTVGPEPHVFKAKDGQLTVVRPHQGTGSMVLAFPSDTQPLWEMQLSPRKHPWKRVVFVKQLLNRNLKDTQFVFNLLTPISHPRCQTRQSLDEKQFQFLVTRNGKEPAG